MGYREVEYILHGRTTKGWASGEGPLGVDGMRYAGGVGGFESKGVDAPGDGVRGYSGERERDRDRARPSAVAKTRCILRRLALISALSIVDVDVGTFATILSPHVVEMLSIILLTPCLASILEMVNDILKSKTVHWYVGCNRLACRLNKLCLNGNGCASILALWASNGLGVVLQIRWWTRIN